jgi:hypothetical protein
MFKPQTINGVQLTSEMVEQIVKNATEKKEFIKVGQRYWFLTDVGIDTCLWKDCSRDEARLIIGNVFLTEEAVKKVNNKRKAFGAIRQYIRDNGLEFKPDWSDDKQKKWQITGWDYLRNNCHYDWFCLYDISRHNLIFKSQEDRQKVLDNCAKELEVLLK